MLGSKCYGKVKTFKYLGSLLTNQNSIREEIKWRQMKKSILLIIPNTFVFLTSLEELEN